VTYSSIVDEPTHVYREVRQCKQHVSQHVQRLWRPSGGKAPSSHTQTAHSIQNASTIDAPATQPLGVRICSCKKPSLDRNASQHRKSLHHDLPVSSIRLRHLGKDRFATDDDWPLRMQQEQTRYLACL
jgi:hypothetical protein